MSGVALWYLSDQKLQAACRARDILTDESAEHARLKDHVTSMDGGLEAKIQEGFVSPFPFTALSSQRPVSHIPSTTSLQCNVVVPLHIYMHPTPLLLSVSRSSSFIHTPISLPCTHYTACAHYTTSQTKPNKTNHLSPS